MLNIYFNNNEKYIDEKKVKKDFDKIFKTANKILNKSNKRIVDINFVSGDEIRKINHTYRNKDKETDVISFAFDESGMNVSNYVGEIYICSEIAKKQSELYHHSIRREVDFLFTHGLLHLYGYDHLNEDDEKIMFDLQEKILEKCKIYREKYE